MLTLLKDPSFLSQPSRPIGSATSSRPHSIIGTPPETKKPASVAIRCVVCYHSKHFLKENTSGPYPEILWEQRCNNCKLSLLSSWWHQGAQGFYFLVSVFLFESLLSQKVLGFCCGHYWFCCFCLRGHGLLSAPTLLHSWGEGIKSTLLKSEQWKHNEYTYPLNDFILYITHSHYF